MKKILLQAFVCFIVCSASAQRLHLNILGGISNYGGDLQSKQFALKGSKGAIALGASYEISNKFYLRSEYSFSSVGADDAKGTNAYQLRRNLNFKSYIQELNLLGEYNILDIYQHRLVPYVFAGVGLFRFSPYTFDSLGNKYYLQGLHTEGQGLPQYPDREVYRKTQWAMPLGAGVKFALSDNIRVGAEFGLRKLFTDYLDDVSTEYPDLALLSPEGAAFSYRGDELKPPIPFLDVGAKRGNSGANDSYYFLMFRISYRLPFGGENDNGGSGAHSGKAHRSCPPVRL